MHTRKIALGAVLIGATCPGCIGVSQTTVTKFPVVPKLQSGKPRMKKEQVIRIAKQTAVREGYLLKDYLELKARFRPKSGEWWVVLDHKPPSYPGSLSLIYVDDQTGKARLSRGQ